MGELLDHLKLACDQLGVAATMEREGQRDGSAVGLIEDAIGCPPGEALPFAMNQVDRALKEVREARDVLARAELLLRNPSTEPLPF